MTDQHPSPGTYAATPPFRRDAQPGRLKKTDPATQRSIDADISSVETPGSDVSTENNISPVETPGSDVSTENKIQTNNISCTNPPFRRDAHPGRLKKTDAATRRSIAADIPPVETPGSDVSTENNTPPVETPGSGVSTENNIPPVKTPRLDVSTKTTTEKFQKIYRVDSIRLKTWDYSNPGYYFVTILVKNRACLFGSIYDSGMNLSAIGFFADKHWREIPDHFPGVSLDAFVIMPNHLHGIIVINPPESPSPTGKKPGSGVSSKDQRDNAWKSGNLGVVINQFKRICTMDARKADPQFSWQPRYYEHIIRNEQELSRIREYIESNPQHWSEDDHYPVQTLDPGVSRNT